MSLKLRKKNDYEKKTERKPQQPTKLIIKHNELMYTQKKPKWNHRCGWEMRCNERKQATKRSKRQPKRDEKPETFY